MHAFGFYRGKRQKGFKKQYVCISCFLKNRKKPNCNFIKRQTWDWRFIKKKLNLGRLMSWIMETKTIVFFNGDMYRQPKIFEPSKLTIVELHGYWLTRNLDTKIFPSVKKNSEKTFEPSKLTIVEPHGYWLTRNLDTKICPCVNKDSGTPSYGVQKWFNSWQSLKIQEQENDMLRNFWSFWLKVRWHKIIKVKYTECAEIPNR